MTCALVAILTPSVFAYSMIGFRTDDVDNYSISYDGSQTTISFGDSIINNARHNTTLAASLLNAHVQIAPVIIDLSSKNVIAQFGPYQYAEYQLLPLDPIVDGFKIVIDQDVVFTGDLLVSSARFLIKSGSIDPAVSINVTNVELDTANLLDPVALALLSDLADGGDLNITIEDTSANDIVAAIDNHSLITGIFAGTFAAAPDNIPIPEPVTMILLLIGFGVSYLKRRKTV